MTQIVVLSVADDWEGLYVDGEKVCSGHSIDMQDLEHLFRKLDIGVDFRTSTQWSLFDVTHWDAPDKLPEGFDPEAYDEEDQT